MAIFEVHGGRKLSGEITPQGAKNEALQVISAVLLTKEPVTIHNIPDITDVNLLISLLKDMNVKVTRNSEHSYTFIADDVNIEFLQNDAYTQQSAKLRGSVMFAGPLL